MKKTYRLLSGSHRVREKGHESEGKTIRRGKTVTTETDLIKLFPNKFELAGDSAPDDEEVAPETADLGEEDDDELDKMTIPQLREYAKDIGVEIPNNVTKRDDIQKFIEDAEEE